MNTPSEVASARVFRRVLARTLWRGRAASRPFVVRRSLSDTFVVPAVAALTGTGAIFRLGHPLRRLTMTNGRASELVFDDQVVHLDHRDVVVLAVPWVVAAGLLPGLPDLPSSPIVNAHFRLSAPPAKLSGGGFIGLLGGTAQWLFRRDSVVSVTVSAAGDLAERSVGELADLLWADVAKALQLHGFPAATRVIKEKRATLFHTSEVEAKRPSPRPEKTFSLPVIGRRPACPDPGRSPSFRCGRRGPSPPADAGLTFDTLPVGRQSDVT